MAEDVPLAKHSCVARHASGKSSVVSLVMRYYDATHGKVSFTCYRAVDTLSQLDMLQSL